MTTEELNALIERRLSEGWQWNDWFNSGQLTLSPPPGDPRRNWCAQWLKLDENHSYPHWIDRDP